MKCVSLLKETKKAYYSISNMKNNNKKFWESVKSCFSDKSSNFENITLIENGKLLTNYFEIPEILRKYFQNPVVNLDL